MNISALDREMRLQRRDTRYFANIDVLVVLNGYGQTVGIYRGTALVRDWLALGEDEFFRSFGFRWTPPERMRRLAMQNMR